MKIIYEVGDYVTVEDDTDAGDLAGYDIELVRKTGPTTWYVVTRANWCTPENESGEIDEKWFQRF